MNLPGNYRIVISNSAKTDVSKIKAIPPLQKKVSKLLETIAEDPYKNPPAYEKLRGDLAGFYSRRINIQHRLVYDVDDEKRIVRIISMWSHYETIK